MASFVGMVVLVAVVGVAHRRQATRSREAWKRLGAQLGLQHRQIGSRNALAGFFRGADLSIEQGVERLRFRATIDVGHASDFALRTKSGLGRFVAPVRSALQREPRPVTDLSTAFDIACDDPQAFEQYFNVDRTALVRTFASGFDAVEITNRYVVAETDPQQTAEVARLAADVAHLVRELERVRFDDRIVERIEPVHTSVPARRRDASEQPRPDDPYSASSMARRLFGVEVTPQDAHRCFHEDYRGAVVEWMGQVMRARDHSALPGARGMTLTVRVDGGTPEDLRDDIAVLVASDNRLAVRRGSRVRFRGTLDSIDRRRRRLTVTNAVLSAPDD